MNITTIKRLKKKLEKLRNQTANAIRADYVRFANSIGRFSGKSGKEMVFKSEILPHSRGISIPKSPRINKHTAGDILDLFELDIYYLEEMANKNNEE